MDKSEKITLKEFRAWLDGLLAGRDMEREALPTRDQWAKILAKIEAIYDNDDAPIYITRQNDEKHVDPTTPGVVYIVTTKSNATTSIMDPSWWKGNG